MIGTECCRHYPFSPGSARTNATNMRLDSLLFVTARFACFDTLSTRLISTSVGPVMPNQEDVSVRGFDKETIKALEVFYLPKAIEKISSMASRFV